ncbi:hypothetical protein SynMITS9220_01343 [Synechococcus sp. MIT S9220]|nr:hypothetical protein SynMITS9220_01343 [Synechococcus sp. MIT S9220]
MVISETTLATAPGMQRQAVKAREVIQIGQETKSSSKDT